MSGTGPNNRGFVRWIYGDWRRQSTLDAQIERLQRHIEEVERYAFDATQNGSRLIMHQNMLPRLTAELEKLESRRTLRTNPAFTRVGGVQRFTRGSGS